MDFSNEYLTEKTVWKMLKKKGLGSHWRHNNGNSFHVGCRHPDFYSKKDHKVIELFGRNYHDEAYAIGNGVRVSAYAGEQPTLAYYGQIGWQCLVIWSFDRKETASNQINNFVGMTNSHQQGMVMQMEATTHD